MPRGSSFNNRVEGLVPEYDESDTRVDDWQTVEKKRAAQGKSAHKETPQAFNGPKRSGGKGNRTEICMYYPNCARGDNCWFLHDDDQIGKRSAASSVPPRLPPNLSRPSTSTSQPAEEANKKPGADYKLKSKMCTYHVQGYCSRGSSCTYAHSPSELRSHSAAQNGAPPSRSNAAPSDFIAPNGRGNNHGSDISGRMAEMDLGPEDDEAPDSFCCPITHEILRDPVVACDGYSYERTAIKDWFQKHDTSPMTNEVLESKYLVPNLALRAAILVLYNVS